MDNWRHGLLTVVALLGGFALSFVGLGVLWVGVPWTYQMLMFFPFLLLALAVMLLGRYFGGRLSGRPAGHAYHAAVGDPGLEFCSRSP